MGVLSQDSGGITRQYVEEGFLSPALTVWLKVKRVIYWFAIQPWISHLATKQHVVEKGALYRRAVELMKQLAQDPKPLLEGTAPPLLFGPERPNPGLDAARVCLLETEQRTEWALELLKVAMEAGAEEAYDHTVEHQEEGRWDGREVTDAVPEAAAWGSPGDHAEEGERLAIAKRQVRRCKTVLLDHVAGSLMLKSGPTLEVYGKMMVEDPATFKADMDVARSESHKRLI